MSSLPTLTAEPSSPPARRSLGLWSLFWSAVLLLAVGFLVYFVFSVGNSSFVSADATRAKEREKILADRVAEDQKMLQDQPSWFSKDKGLVRIPIDRAMSLTVTELAQVQPHPAYPISQSPPQPASALQAYGTLAPGKSMKAPAPLPTGAQAAGSPAPAPDAAAPAATPVPASPDAAASSKGTAPAPAPTLVAPPPPGPGPAANSVPAPAAAGTPAEAAPASPSPSATVTPPAAQPASSDPWAAVTPPAAQPASPAPAPAGTPAAAPATTP